MKSFEQWLAASGGSGRAVFTHPLIASRALHEPLPLPDLSEEGGNGKARASSKSLSLPGGAQAADGIELLLRVAVLWQQVAESPLRRTIQGGFFKRDAESLGHDPLLTSPAADNLADVPDLGFFLAELAECEGILRGDDNEVKAGTFPESWEGGLNAALESVWRNLFSLRVWNPLDGWRAEEPTGNPFPSAYLLAFLLLARLPEDAWLPPTVIEKWLLVHHPYWQPEDQRPSRQKPWLEAFLLGVAYPLRLVEVQPDKDGALVRLTPTGRWLLGYGDEPEPDASFPKTLLAQPNLEIVAFRQGLTPGLIARLTRFANWKSLGAACTLQLEPASVYRGLESGLSFETMRLTLEQHGTRAVPPAVLDALRTWSNKRDRITVFPSATLLEFATPEDLTEALARGLQAASISGTMAIVANEEQIDYSRFRLTSTRDYALPPEKCVGVEPDGVTLTVDQSRSDLLLETDLPRLAVPLGAAVNGKRQYRITPESLVAARDNGITLSTLELWFTQRTGFPLPPAARLLMIAAEVPPPRFQRQLLLHVATEEIADGLLQWPQTRNLIEASRPDITFGDGGKCGEVARAVAGNGGGGGVTPHTYQANGLEPERLVRSSPRPQAWVHKATGGPSLKGSFVTTAASGTAPSGPKKTVGHPSGLRPGLTESALQAEWDRRP